MVAAFAVVIVCAKRDIDNYNFKQYVSDFGRTYAKGSAEYEMREKIFNQNLAEVRAHNAGSHAYMKGINQFSDQTEVELNRMMGSGAVKSQRRSGSVKAQLGNAPLPREVDWRNVRPSILTAVKNQGHCGSCWAHGAVESVESYVALATGNLFVFSTQQVTACAPNPRHCGGQGGCQGSIPELGFDYLTNFSVATEWQYPYTAGNGTTGECKRTGTTSIRLHGFTKLKENSQEEVMQAPGNARSACRKRRVQWLAFVRKWNLHRLRLRSQHHDRSRRATCRLRHGRGEEDGLLDYS